MIKKSHLLIVLLFFSAHVWAQQPRRQAVEETIYKMADLIRANYVIPEQGEYVAEHLLEDLKKGRFYEAKTLKQLESEMTKSLREPYDDFHLYVIHDREMVKQLRSQNEEESDTEYTSFFNNEEAVSSNFGLNKVEILEGNIGYLKISEINISVHSLPKLYAAMNLVENTNALVIDLIDNTGGGSAVGAVLETFFLEQPEDLLEFRTRNGDIEMESTVPWLLEKRYTKPLYVLVNENTASASEAFVFGLKNLGRCTIVGEQTAGGAYWNDYFPVTDDFVLSVSVGAPFLPGANQSWQGSGIVPDYQATEAEALTRAIELIRAR